MQKQILGVNGKLLRTRDSMNTFDRRTIDSTGAFLVGELERLDQTLHMPLVSVTWQRDIKLRSDVSMADEQSSFTISSFAASGGMNPTGKSWAGKSSNANTEIEMDIGKVVNNLNVWSMGLSYTIPELLSAQKIGRPVDAQKYEGLKLKYQMDVDEQVNIGDSVLGVTGLVNNAAVSNVTNVANGAGGGASWFGKNQKEILKDVNEILNSTWAASAYALAPYELRIPPAQFSYISNTPVSEAGNSSILQYIRDNAISTVVNGVPLNIQPSKWLVGRGAGDLDRMIAYTNEEERIRFPSVPLQRTPLEYRGLYQSVQYFGRLGVVEVVYPEALAFRDGL